MKFKLGVNVSAILLASAFFLTGCDKPDSFVGCYAPSNNDSARWKIEKMDGGYKFSRLENEMWTSKGGVFTLKTNEIKGQLNGSGVEGAKLASAIEEALAADGIGVVIRLKKELTGPGKEFKSEFLAIAGIEIFMTPVGCQSK